MLISTKEVKNLLTYGTTSLAIAGACKVISLLTRQPNTQILCVETETMDENPHILKILVEIESFFSDHMEICEVVTTIDKLLFLEKTLCTKKVEPCMMDRVHSVLLFKTMEYALKHLKYRVENEKTPRKVAAFHMLCERLVSTIETHMTHIFQLTLHLDMS